MQKLLFDLKLSLTRSLLKRLVTVLLCWPITSVLLAVHCLTVTLRTANRIFCKALLNHSLCSSIMAPFALQKCSLTCSITFWFYCKIACHQTTEQYSISIYIIFDGSNANHQITLHSARLHSGSTPVGEYECHDYILIIIC